MNTSPWIVTSPLSSVSLLISGVFVLLSASLDFEVLRLFEWRFAAFLFALLFLVRPATVLIALAFSKLPWNERLLIAWIAPRGVVAVAVSGLFALRLDQLGLSLMQDAFGPFPCTDPLEMPQPLFDREPPPPINSGKRKVW